MSFRLNPQYNALRFVLSGGRWLLGDGGVLSGNGKRYALLEKYAVRGVSEVDCVYYLGTKSASETPLAVVLVQSWRVGDVRLESLTYGERSARLEIESRRNA